MFLSLHQLQPGVVRDCLNNVNSVKDVNNINNVNLDNNSKCEYLKIAPSASIVYHFWYFFCEEHCMKYIIHLAGIVEKEVRLAHGVCWQTERERVSCE